VLFGRERAMEISEGSVVLFGREGDGVGRLVGGLSLFGRERAVEVLSVDSRFRRRAIYGGSMDSEGRWTRVLRQRSLGCR